MKEVSMIEMKETIFRIWDTKNNEWLAESDENALTYYGFTLLGEVMHMQPIPINDGSLIIEEATGIEDKNGTMIYQGDIIQFVVAGEAYVREVIKKPDYACFMLTKEGSTPYSFLEMYQMSVTEFEVIGNIHEYDKTEVLETKGINQ